MPSSPHAAAPSSAPQASAAKIMATPGFLYATVMVMGAVGACLRYLLGIYLPTSPLPFGTLAINLFGCYFIYVIYQWFGRRVHLPHAIVRGLGVGLVGAFTTLSAFSTEGVAYLQNGQFAIFALYLALTMTGTFAASLLGWVTVSSLEKRRLRKMRATHAHRVAQAHAHPASQGEGADGEAPQDAARATCGNSPSSEQGGAQ